MKNSKSFLAILAVLIIPFAQPGSAGEMHQVSAPQSTLSKESSPGESPINNDHIIRGLRIEGDYALYGSKYDGVTLTDSTISGALKIDGVRNVVIKRNHLNSIWFRGDQPTDNVTIDHNDISEALADCIHIHDGKAPASHVVIQNNDIHDCGVGHPTSNLYHAIYDQVPGVIIRGNCISNARAAVSVRSNALIENNFIDRVPSGGAIEYFYDHDAEPGSHLIIRGNTISTALTNSLDATSSNRGLIVLGNDIGKGRRPVSYIEVEENKLAVLNPAENQGSGKFYAIYLQGNLPNARLSGNTMVSLIPNGKFIGPYSAGADLNNEKTHGPQALNRIASAPPPCH